MIRLLVIGVLGVCLGAPAGDLVDIIPSFKKAPFPVYSGYLYVPGPVAGYDSMTIHYQFHYSQRNPKKDPLVTWHQGGPGGSSLFGLYAEMGYFQVSDKGSYVNPYAWNKVANMLYLESPAGVGYSTCSKGGRVASTCSWNDVNQGEAYAHTLKAFYKAFPEFKDNDLYLTGESYAGQYTPNIAHFILNNKGYADNLKGLALGNACWGGDATHVRCNGPNSQQNDVDMFYGKGLFSKKLYEAIYKACYPTRSSDCSGLIKQMDDAVGPHNTYFIYDNCPRTEEWLARSGKTMTWLRTYLRNQMNTGNYSNDELLQLGGGYDWSCGGMDAEDAFLDRADVMKALHLNNSLSSRFSYDTSGPASITLYPELAKKLRILIYNGDADACVPYKGNEEWTTGLAEQGILKENKPWHPWYVEGAPAHIPAGYATTYTVPGTSFDFSFVTIRLAGHMVPTFQPQASLSFFERFLAGTPF